MLSLDPVLPWIVCVALLTLRLTVALALSPALSAYGVPAIVRVALTLVLAALTFAYRTPLPEVAAWIGEPTSLLLPMLAEVFIGALLGLGVHVVLAGLALAGKLMDVQIGFSIGSIFDPVTGSNANIIGSITGLLGVVIFFTSDAHLQLAQLLAQSLDALPLGHMPAFDDPLRPLLAAGSMFTLGVALAAPVAMALLLTDVAVGVASRNMPQINVLVLVIPVKVVIGYAVLALTLTGWGPLLSREFRRMAQVVAVH